MINTLPDILWDDVLDELIRIMKKGAYIECVEAYDNLFDAGPSMTKLNECKRNIYSVWGIFKKFIHVYIVIQQSLQHQEDNSTFINPWPNRIANRNQFIGMQIYHTHTPVGLYGGETGSLLLEYWERAVKGFRRDWIDRKLITDVELDELIESMKDEVDKHNTYMSWYSVVAQKKGYLGPTIQFDDVDDFDRIHTTIF